MQGQTPESSALLQWLEVLEEPAGCCPQTSDSGGACSPVLGHDAHNAWISCQAVQQLQGLAGRRREARTLPGLVLVICVGPCAAPT